MVRADILRAIELLNLAEVAYDNPNIVAENAQAFHHEYDTYQILTVAGTNSILDAIQDIEAFPTVYREWAGDVHPGVAHHMEEILSIILGRLVKKPIEMAAHSLGAGVIQLLALRLMLAGYTISRVTTFGGLRVGLANWVEKYERANIPTIRWINGSDPVPHEPPSPLYYHAGPGLGIVDGVLVAIIDAPAERLSEVLHPHHFITAYRAAFADVLAKMV